MTERYIFDPSINHFTDTKTDKRYCEYNLDEVVDMLNKYEKENSLFKKIFNEMIRQTQVEIQPNNTKYSGTFIFTGEQFQLLRELMKED